MHGKLMRETHVHLLLATCYNMIYALYFQFTKCFLGKSVAKNVTIVLLAKNPFKTFFHPVNVKIESVTFSFVVTFIIESISMLSCVCATCHHFKTDNRMATMMLVMAAIPLN